MPLNEGTCQHTLAKVGPTSILSMEMFVGWEGGAVAESNILRVNDKCKLCVDLLNVPEARVP